MLAFFLPVPTTANTVVDSLEKVLEGRPTLDSHRVDMLNKLGFEYWIIDPAQSEKYGEQALELSKVLKYPEGEAFAHRIIGVAHWARGNYDPALEFLFRSFEKYQSLGDTLGVANSQLNIGMVYGDQLDHKQALSYYDSALKGFELLKADDRIATTFTKIGTVYANQNEYDKAYEYFDNALKIHEEKKFLYGQAEVNNRLGILFSEKGEWNVALTYLLRSLETGSRRSDFHGMASNYAQIGRIYLRKDDLERADTFLLKGQGLAETLDIKKTLKDIYYDLMLLETARKDTRKALDFFGKYDAVKDSLFNEEKALQVANLRTQHALSTQKQELKIQEQEIALLEAQNRNGRYLLIAAFLGLVLLGLGAYRILRHQKLKNQLALSSEKKLREKKEEQLATEKEKSKGLEEELAQKNKELTAYTVNFIRKNELINGIRETLREIKSTADGVTNKKVSSLENQLRHALQIDEDWEAFRRHFESVHHDFFAKLKNRHPDLSSNDLKLCTLARLNLDSKEMATMLGISPDSVKTARYRLRKKMNLESGESILDHLVKLEQD